MDIAKRINANRMSALRTYEQSSILHNISHALIYIYSEGLYHCDIKPENILLSDNGKRADLCDFGQSI